MRAGWLWLLVLAPLVGCELVADFDRGKIPGSGTPDSGVLVRDAGADDDAGDADTAK
jgi:hypothetical protein